eukprot:10676238-Karenia_brevis.AAC.1
MSHFTHTNLFIQLPSDISSHLELVMLQLQSTFTKSQRQAYMNGTLQIPTRKFRGLGVIHCATPLKQLSESLSEYLQSLPSSAGQPKPGRATVFCCPQGHTRPAEVPFDAMNPGKQVWCKQCAKPVAGCNWHCTCDKVWYSCFIHFSSPFPHSCVTEPASLVTEPASPSSLGLG